MAIDNHAFADQRVSEAAVASDFFAQVAGHERTGRGAGWLFQTKTAQAYVLKPSLLCRVLQFGNDKELVIGNYLLGGV